MQAEEVEAFVVAQHVARKGLSMFPTGSTSSRSTCNRFHFFDSARYRRSYLTATSIICICAFVIVPILALVPGSLFVEQARASTMFAPVTLNESHLSHISRMGRTNADIMLSSINVANGITLSSSILATPAGNVSVHTLDIDLSNSRVHLGVVEAYNHLIGPGETVSSMANRTRAVAGVNGDYFEVNGPGRPIGMLSINDRLQQSPTFYAMFGITQSGSPVIDHESFSADVTNGNTSHTLDSVNIYNDANKGKLVLLTPELGGPVPVTGDTVALLQPVSGSDTSFSVQGVQPARSYPVLRGRYALVGGYHAGNWLAQHVHKGDRLTITASTSPDDNLSLAIGGGPILVKDGGGYHDTNPPAPAEVNVRNPLTAISTNRDGTTISFIAFDGRGAGPTRSAGLTHAQATSYLLTHGAYNAMLFDTGGSTVMVSRLHQRNSVSVVNSPSDGFERPVANGLFAYSS
jgi:exopolysaccharide biosynthesis protein